MQWACWIFICSSVHQVFIIPFIFLWLIIGVFAYLWSVCFKLRTCFKFCNVLSSPALCSSLTEKPWLWGMGFPQYQEPHPALNWHVPWLLTSVNPVVRGPEPKIRMRVLNNFKTQSERGEWKSWLKAQHSENEDHGIQSHHFTANRWGNNGYSGWLYFSGLQNHFRWWLQPWN